MKVLVSRIRSLELKPDETGAPLLKGKPVKGHRIGVKVVGISGLRTWKPSKHTKRKTK